MDITQRDDGALTVPAACLAILRGTLKPSLAVCALTTLVFLVARGTGAALASLLAAALTVGCFACGLYLLSRIVNASPLLLLTGAMAVYVGQMFVVGLVIAGLSGASWLDSFAFGISALVVIISWQVFLVAAFVRARRPVYDSPGSDASGLDVTQ